jgi:hypothetical protein
LEALIELGLLSHPRGNFVRGPLLLECALPGRLHPVDFDNVSIIGIRQDGAFYQLHQNEMIGDTGELKSEVLA